MRSFRKVSKLWPKICKLFGRTENPNPLHLYRLSHFSFYCRKHFQKVSFGMAFSSAITFCIILSVISKLKTFNGAFNFRNNLKLEKVMSGE